MADKKSTQIAVPVVPNDSGVPITTLDLTGSPTNAVSSGWDLRTNMTGIIDVYKVEMTKRINKEIKTEVAAHDLAQKALDKANEEYVKIVEAIQPSSTMRNNADAVLAAYRLFEPGAATRVDQTCASDVNPDKKTIAFEIVLTVGHSDRLTMRQNEPWPPAVANAHAEVVKCEANVAMHAKRMKDLRDEKLAIPENALKVSSDITLDTLRKAGSEGKSIAEILLRVVDADTKRMGLSDRPALT